MKKKSQQVPKNSNYNKSVSFVNNLKYFSNDVRPSENEKKAKDKVEVITEEFPKVSVEISVKSKQQKRQNHRKLVPSMNVASISQVFKAN